MRRRIVFAGSVFLTAATLSASAAPDADKAWNGAWKLDAARSHFSGVTFEIAATAKGFHFSGTAGMSYDFACDGKDYPLAAGVARTLACTANPDGSYDTFSKVDGKETSHSHRSFTADGMEMVVETTSFGVDGKPVSVDGDVLKATNVFRRIVPGAELKVDTAKGGEVRAANADPKAKKPAAKLAAPPPAKSYANAGMAGRWENVHSSANAPVVQIVTLRGEVLHIEYPANRMAVTATLDGKDAPVTGADAEEKQTLSVMPEGAQVWHLVSKIDGQPTLEALQSLSSDGKTLTSVEWRPGRETEKSTFVYAKE